MIYRSKNGTIKGTRQIYHSSAQETLQQIISQYHAYTEQHVQYVRHDSIIWYVCVFLSSTRFLKITHKLTEFVVDVTSLRV
jgi:hypothetical protein